MSETARHAAPDGIPPLPAGARLLHIGPHKTGTTALQGALHTSRGRLREHGVVYGGKARQAKDPAVAVLSGATGEKRAPWEALCAEGAEAAAGGRRLAVSSEFFADAGDEAARTAVRELGPDVHVVVTLRPLHKILPSHWQQYVKHGLCHSYEDWLEGMLRRPPYTEPTPDFWHRQQHDALLARWAGAAGPENVTAVVVDERDPEWLFRVFEGLLDLPQGFLEPGPRDLNTSLTLPQAELLLELNRRLDAEGWSNARRNKVVREGVVPQLVREYRAAPDEPRITTPGWAVDAAVEVAEETVARIPELGVRVIGDLKSLTRRPAAGPGPGVPPPTETLPAALAVEAALGGILAGVTLGKAEAPPARAPRARTKPAEGGPKSPEDRPVSQVPARRLLRIAARRAGRRLHPGRRT
ncbi:hypothetical protein [Streptomyces sp. JJ36]|uniref:hypothetical protein n=1 Tax=Streptomyces sp. JJ36 TaxID=2736645 RepID=UPI001F1CB11F|nr:hypothetical protein [Streptomyces sp. JJ36]MCF6525118.1 hypothetical protein [Streptomyces sp. JJ36]